MTGEVEEATTPDANDREGTQKMWETEAIEIFGRFPGNAGRRLFFFPEKCPDHINFTAAG